MFQLARDRARRLGNGKCFLYLAQNLRLAHHHGIETGRHPEQVVDCLRVAILINVWFNLRCFNSELAFEKTSQRL